MRKALRIARIGLSISSLFLAGAFLFASYAHADTLTQFQNTYAATSTTNGALQSLGTGLAAASVTEINGGIYISSFSSSGVSHIRAQVVCYNDAARTTSTGSCLNASGGNTFATASTTISVTAVGQFLLFTTVNLYDRSGGAGGDGSTTPMPVDSSKYYFITGYDLTTSGTFGYKDIGIAASVTHACVSNCGGLGAIYYQLYQDTVSNITAVSPISSPADQSTTLNTFPRITFSYVNASTYNFAGVRLVDVQGSQNTFMPEEAITGNGTFSYAETAHLVSGHFYQATPYIRNSVSGDYVYGTLTSFFAVSNTITNFDNLSTTTSTGLFGSGFSLHDALLAKVPFAWIAQIYAIILTSTATSTGNFPSFSMNLPFGQTLGNFNAATGTQVEIFGTSTVDNATDHTFIQTVDVLMAAFIYFDGLMVLYMLRKQLFH